MSTRREEDKWLWLDLSLSLSWLWLDLSLSLSLSVKLVLTTVKHKFNLLKKCVLYYMHADLYETKIKAWLT